MRVGWRRPDLKDAWDPMNKKQRTELLQQLWLLQHQDKDTMAEEQQEPFEVTWEHEDGTTDTTIAQPLASSAAGAGQQRAGAVSASLSVPASMIAGDHEQTQRASWEQEKLRDISATALEKLASISASRTSKLTPDANPKSDVSGKCLVRCLHPVVASTFTATPAGAAPVERDD